ncbi:MAG: aldo/keto reductase [Nitrososphaeraceae archaeon]|nr:aldo/keto reductase [Nitrososphaeraceae archaeon]
MSSTFNSLNGFATPVGTKKYLEYAIQKAYLGQASSEDDKDIENAVYESIKSGAINVIDTAINYRAMKSEKSIGRALCRLIKDDIISRDEFFISTKNGYITNDGDYPTVDVMEYMQKMFISPEIIKPNDISSGYNVLNPSYIARCIDKSLANMHLECIDLVYVHNAFESWFEDVSREEFMHMLSKVFEVYEEYRSQHVGGKQHGFRFIQLPYNLAYNEPIFLKNQDVGSIKNLTILEAAQRLNIGVFTSIPLFQSRLLNARIPDYAGLTNQVEKLIQIIRSTPAVISPLIGQKKPEHVLQNINIANIPPLSNLEYKKTIQTLFNSNA